MATREKPTAAASERKGTDSAGHSVEAPAAKAIALAEWPLGKEVELGIRWASRGIGMPLVCGRGRPCRRLETWLASRLVMATETSPRVAARRARAEPLSAITAEMPSQIPERSAKRVSRGMAASSSGLRVSATASKTAVSRASTWASTARQRRVRHQPFAGGLLRVNSAIPGPVCRAILQGAMRGSRASVGHQPSSSTGSGPAERGGAESWSGRLGWAGSGAHGERAARRARSDRIGPFALSAGTDVVAGPPQALSRAVSS
ncbi:hypothetical protein CLV29_2307 [Naumannella halotolerans]|uniref:Uncharacterized protein n=1 Tax=Naumannella halotolerans TaxID=993414 RepID=A0A4R7J1C4_9ACTN|nr:hypothetical protein CLV29_2307 [Naumannella halotolerans]